MPSITPIGSTNWRNQYIPFGIKDKDRSGHIYCLGKTGTGKSTLLLNMAIADITQGKGVGIIDPHGDLAETLLKYIPENRIADVIYFNVTDRDYAISYNPLVCVNDQERYVTVAAIVTTLKKLWADSWGPRLEHILRNTLLTLSYHSESTLLDIVPLLTNHTFRRKVLYAVSNNDIHQFWQKEFEPLSPQLKNEFIAPILNKVGLFTMQPEVKLILGQTQSSFTIEQAMNTKKIFIANLSKGIIGEAATTLLGSLLVTQFQIASIKRTTLPMEERTPFYLFIDEAHSFITKSFADILSESRKYGLALFLTHQFIDQLPEEIYHSIIGNAGTLITFRLGSHDAAILAEEFIPTFSAEDIVALPQYAIYIKLLIDGSTSKPFSAITYPIRTPVQSNASFVIQSSRIQYATPKEEAISLCNQRKKAVETEIPTATLF